MKKWRSWSLSLRLLAGFFSAIFVLSVFHIISYSRLLGTMKQEAQTSANERMTSAVARLEEDFSYIRNAYFGLTYTPAYRQATRTGSPSNYEIVALSHQATINLSFDETIFAFAILFRDANELVSSNGTYMDEDFFSRYYTSEAYDAEFWRQEKLGAFSQQPYQAADFQVSNPVFANSTKMLMPIAFKSYWNSNAMVLALIDIQAICQRADLYLAEDFYIFDTETGELLFSSAEEAALTSLPETDAELIEMPSGVYLAQRHSASNGFTYVKVLPKNNVVGQITTSLYTTIFIALLAFAIGIAIAVFAVWRLMHPVQNILRLLPSGDEEGIPQDELQYIQTSVEQMLHQREQHVQQLTKKDAALSGFLLQSQLKNIYVELDVPDETASAEDMVFTILYLRIHYRSGALDAINAEAPAVAHMFLDDLQHMLNLLFDTALIFQLEANQFVAKVSHPAHGPAIDTQMQQLLERLDHERDFAFFTVVQSTPLTSGGNITAIYEQVLDAAQYASLESKTQLLHLPLDTAHFTSFSFSAAQEECLQTKIREGRREEAQHLVESVIEENLSRGIRRVHMLLLCSALTSSTVRALAELRLPGDTPSINSSGIFNQLPYCDTAEDYTELVTGFVASAAQLAAQHATWKDPILDNVQAFLEKNYQQEFSMDELADALHLSKSYLSTYYKNKTGTNLSDSIQFFRIQKAVILLADKDLRVGDVGKLVGISNINTFLRQFKKYTGMTPKEYRIRKLSID